MILQKDVTETIKNLLNRIAKDYNIEKFSQFSPTDYEEGRYKSGDWTYHDNQSSMVTVIKWLSSTNPRLAHIKTSFIRDGNSEKLENDLRTGIETLLNVKL